MKRGKSVDFIGYWQRHISAVPLPIQTSVSLSASQGVPLRQLHEAIAEGIIAHKAGMSGKEMRFSALKLG